MQSIARSYKPYAAKTPYLVERRMRRHIGHDLDFYRMHLNAEHGKE